MYVKPVTINASSATYFHSDRYGHTEIQPVLMNTGVREVFANQLPSFISRTYCRVGKELNRRIYLQFSNKKVRNIVVPIKLFGSSLPQDTKKFVKIITEYFIPPSHTGQNWLTRTKSQKGDFSGRWIWVPYEP